MNKIFIWNNIEWNFIEWQFHLTITLLSYLGILKDHWEPGKESWVQNCT